MERRRKVMEVKVMSEREDIAIGTPPPDGADTVTKSESTDIVIYDDDKVNAVHIRYFVHSTRFTGLTRQGVRVPREKLNEIIAALVKRQSRSNLG